MQKSGYEFNLNFSLVDKKSKEGYNNNDKFIPKKLLYVFYIIAVAFMNKSNA